ncbi:MAG: glycosyltransferase family 4 protein, partial [Planctomycetes bacterium]|nr:glycosyltransferase family 4 protein [Planctomycetota bacterium]
MRVWFLSSAFYPALAGAENQALELGAALVRRGVEVHVLTRCWPGTGPEDVVRGVAVHRRGPAYAMPDDTMRFSRWGSLRAALAWSLALARRRGAFDLLHANQVFSAATVGWLAARLSGIPLVVKVPGALAAEMLAGRQGRRLVRRASAIVVPNPETARTLSAWFPGARVVHIPNGVPDADARPAEAVDPGRVLFVGRLVAGKRVDSLLAAWPEVTSRHPGAQLDIVGYGEERASLEALARSLGIGTSVEFHGKLYPPAVRALLAKASAFVQPSNSEGVSNSLLEAAAAGVPAVVSDISGNRAVIHRPDTGYVVPAGDSAALARAIHAALADPLEARERAARARERVRSLFGMERVADQYLDLYGKLLRERAGRPRIVRKVPARKEARQVPRRLLVVSSKPHWRSEGEVFTVGGFPRQVAAIASLFDETRLCVPVAGTGPRGGTSMTRLGMSVRPLPVSASQAGWGAKALLLWNLLLALPVVNAELGRATLLHARLPSYEGLLALILVRGRRVPTLAWLGGNWMEGIRITRESAFRRWVAAHLPSVLAFALKGHVAFVMGAQFPEGIPGVGAFRRDVATSVWASEIADPRFRSWPASPGKLALVYVGRLSREKGPDVLIEALADRELALAAARVSLALSLTVIGVGPMEEELRSRARGLPVTWRGRLPRDELGEALARMDLFVLPSRADASPKVVVEAMLAGLPVVASSAGGVPRLLGGGERGLLVEPGDPSALARGIARLVEDGSLRGRLAQAAHLWAREQTLDAQRDRIREALRERYGPGLLGEGISGGGSSAKPAT